MIIVFPSLMYTLVDLDIALKPFLAFFPFLNCKDILNL